MNKLFKNRYLPFLPIDTPKKFASIAPGGKKPSKVVFGRLMARLQTPP
jgi:hypothetical protein